MKHKVHTLDLAMLIGAAAALIFSAFLAFTENCERAQDEVFRLHILANSDSDDDQRLKYALRDYVLTDLAYIFDGCESSADCTSAAEQNKAEIEEKAQHFVEKMGYDYKIKCEVEEMYFTTRKYETLTMPAGDYSALRLIIGAGEGRNWWCVIFPSLCLPAVSEIKIPARSELTFGEMYEREIRTEESRDIEVKFWLYEVLRGLFE